MFLCQLTYELLEFQLYPQQEWLLVYLPCLATNDFNYYSNIVTLHYNIPSNRYEEHPHCLHKVASFKVFLYSTYNLHMILMYHYCKRYGIP